MKYLVILVFVLVFNGCYKIGYEGFVDSENILIGKRVPYNTIEDWSFSGTIIGGNFLVAGKGLTHITKNKKGDLIYHIDESEVLPNFYDDSKPKIFRTSKKWVGKCKIYYIVDPKTYIIKSWGFDKGGNPLSCRTWP